MAMHVREREQLRASDVLDECSAATVQRRLNVERLSRIGAWFVAVVAAVMLLDWRLGISWSPVFPEAASMKPSTALALLLSGLALAWVGRSARLRLASRCLSALVALIGAATLAEYLFGLELRLNQLVLWGPDSGPQPGRMKAGTAASLVFAGLSLFNLRAGKRRVRFALCSASVVLSISWLALTGYAYDVSALYRGVQLSAMAVMALGTAVTLFVLGLAILGAEPAAGLVGIATSDTAGGALARPLVPVIPIVFLLLGWAWLAGAQRGLYEESFGVALMVLSATALGVLGLGWHAWLLHTSDLARRRAENDARALALSLADRKFEDLLESTSDAVVIVDQPGAIVQVNAQAESLFGYPRSELLGQPVEMLLPERFRARHVGHRAAYARDPRVRDMGTSLNLYGLRKNGTEFPIKVSLGPVQTHEGLLISSVVRDITAHSKAEQDEARLAAIVASSDDAIFSKTLDGVIQSWNRGAERMFGYRAEEIIGHSVLQLLPEHLLQEEDRMLTQLREGKPVDPYETLRKRKDGSTFDVALTVSLIKDARGRVSAISTIARDITERKAA
jgi:PAS domain S-box-containing protein